MAYVVIEDFRAGLDRRKMPVSAPTGSLQTLTNAHITRGGEIEKRLALVPKYALPVGNTYGFAGANGALYVFGSMANADVPDDITYQQLAHPDGEDMSAIVASEFFDGKIAAAAVYGNGDQLQFYDGTQIADWTSGSGANVAGEKAVDFLTLGSKLYAAHASVLSFSAVEEPTHWQDSEDGTIAGSGFKNMSNQAAGSETLTAIESYQNLMAVFARRAVQIWYLDPDPLQNVQRQVLQNIGTFAPKSVLSFGDVDVFFLSDSGVRSLRARDSSNQAGVTDVGTPIDDLIVTAVKEVGSSIASKAVATLEPISGRYILALGPYAYVFSYFSSSKISAWSMYDFGVQIDNFVSMDGRIWARGGDTVYLLGGDTGDEYDSSPVEVTLPYLDGRQIATFKNFKALDVVCEGEWTVYINTDPQQPDAESEVAIVGSTTLPLDGIGMLGHSPVARIRLTNEAPGSAKLSKIVVHYDTGEDT